MPERAPFEVLNLSLSTIADTEIEFSGALGVSSLILRNRVAADMYLRAHPDDATYYTIPANTVFALDLLRYSLGPGGGYLRAASGNGPAEIVGLRR